MSQKHLDSMTKSRFLYEEMDKGTLPEVLSLIDISEKTGISYRKLQRLVKGRGRYYEPTGAYRICRVLVSRDGRSENGDRNNFGKKQ